jgi:hypothetical protein
LTCLAFAFALLITMLSFTVRGTDVPTLRRSL